jgi:uncharacterized membrane protein
MNTSYLIAALNTMSLSLDSYNADPKQDHLITAAQSACEALTHLTNERMEELIKDSRTLFGRRKKDETAFKEITGSVEHFVRFFLPKEEEIMEKSKVNPSARKRLTTQAAELQLAVRSARSDIEALRRSVEALRSAACEIYQMLKTNQLNAEAQRKTERRLIRIIMGLGGIVLIGLNVGATAAALGLSAAGSAVSAATGEALITAAFDGLLTEN